MKLVKSNGIAGVFKGQVPTMFRDGIGYGYVKQSALTAFYQLFEAYS